MRIVGEPGAGWRCREGMRAPWVVRVVRVVGVLLIGLPIAACTGNLSGPSDPDGTAGRDPIASGAESPDDPMPPLSGTPPTGPIGLTLLVGDTLVDVDTGDRRRVIGQPDLAWGWPLATGRDAAVIMAYCADCADSNAPAELYALPAGATEATRIGAGHNVAPAPDGVWVKLFRTPTDCELTKLSLTGRTLVPARQLDCAVMPREETALGLLVWIDTGEMHASDAILNMDDLEPAQPVDPAEPWPPRIHAVIGERVLGSDDDGFVLTGAGPTVRIESPAGIGTPSDGRISPDGRYVAISFEHPAWPGPRQRLDVWVLDLDSAGWTHLPSMPVAASLKATDEAWAPDGRLVILGEFHEVGQRLVTWRPGQDRLTVAGPEPAFDRVTSLVVR